jgi:hypothetical protein
MTTGPKRYALRPLRSPQEWAAYHAIRRQAIFAALLPGQLYDEADPEETAPGNFPHVLLHDEDRGRCAHRSDWVKPSRAAAGGHPERPPAPRARPRPAQACGRRRAPSRQDRDHHQPPTRRRWRFTSPMAIAKANGARPVHCRELSFGESVWRNNSSRRCRLRGSEFHDRGVAVTRAPNRPQSPPLRGH